jgi:hypothetical protein
MNNSLYSYKIGCSSELATFSENGPWYFTDPANGDIFVCLFTLTFFAYFFIYLFVSFDTRFESLRLEQQRKEKKKKRKKSVYLFILFSANVVFIDQPVGTGFSYADRVRYLFL